MSAVSLAQFLEVSSMVNKRKIATVAVTFGAAMTSMDAAPELQADVLDITWNGGNATATNPFVLGSGSQIPFNIDQLAGLMIDFAQWNDTFGGSGRTLNVGSGIASATVVALGQSLGTADFIGTSVLGAGSQFDGTGSAFIGFRSQAGNVGCFRLDYSVQGPIVYSDGQYGSAGESVVVGVPEPSSTLAAIAAIGAISVRRKRR